MRGVTMHAPRDVRVEGAKHTDDRGGNRRHHQGYSSMCVVQTCRPTAASTPS